MALAWANEGWALHLAECPFGVEGTLRAAVESLDGAGWNWHAWDAAHGMRAHRGLAGTLADAKLQAERALAEMGERSLQTVRSQRASRERPR